MGWRFTKPIRLSFRCENMKKLKLHDILFVLFLFAFSIVTYSDTANIHESAYQNTKTINNLSPKEILNILKNNAWSTSGQSITSAETNNDSNPTPEYEKVLQGDNSAGVNAFADIKFNNNVKRVLDVGGGKFDACRNYLRTKHIELFVWDPYNRSQKHNEKIMREVMQSKVDAATSMAVLNVIPEPAVRLAHIATLKIALKVNGYAYFKVWPGEGKLKGTHMATVNSYGYPGYQANAYAKYFLPEVQLVFGKNNVILDPKIPNLILAKKVTNQPTPLSEIKNMLNHSPEM